jgi:hypothetical protein
MEHLEKAQVQRGFNHSLVNLTKVANVDFRKIIAAKEAPLIALISGKDFAVEYYAQLVFHGIAQPDRIEPIQQLHSFVSDNFSWCTTVDFKLAFEFNAASKLANKHTSFKSFDATYVGSVLSEYYQLRMDAMKKWNEVNVNYIEPARQLESANESLNWFNDSLNKDIENARNGNFMAAELMGFVMLENLYKSGLVTDDYWTDDEWLSFKQRAKRLVHDQQEIGKTKLQRILANPRLKEQYTNSIAREMKVIMYLNYLTKNK